MRASTRVVFGDEAEALRVFGNALREVLGLPPIYDDGRTERGYDAERTEGRFSAVPQPWPRPPEERWMIFRRARDRDAWARAEVPVR